MIAETRNIIKKTDNDPIVDTSALRMLEASGLRAQSDIDHARHMLNVYKHFNINHKVSPQAVHMIKDLEEMQKMFDKHMYPGFFQKNFLSIWRDAQAQAEGMFTDPEHATLVQMRNFLNVHRRGNEYIWKAANDKDGHKFLKKYFRWFPDTIANQQEAYDLKFMRTIVKGTDSEGNFREVMGIRTTSTMGQIHQMLTRLTDDMSSLTDRFKKSKIEQFQIYESIFAQDPERSEILFEYAVAQRELVLARDNPDSVYVSEYNKVKKEYDKISDKMYKSSIDPVTGKTVDEPILVTADEAVKLINDKLTERFKSTYETIVHGQVKGKDGRMYTGSQILVRRRDSNGNDYVDVDLSLNAINELMKYQDKDSPFILGMDALAELSHAMRSERVIEKHGKGMASEIRKMVFRDTDPVTGQKSLRSIDSIKEIVETRIRYKEQEFADDPEYVQKYKHKMRIIVKTIEGNYDAIAGIILKGADPTSTMDLIGRASSREYMRAIGWNPHTFGRYDYNTYFPHLNHPDSVREVYAKRKFLERLKDEGVDIESMSETVLHALYEETKVMHSMDEGSTLVHDTGIRDNEMDGIDNLIDSMNLSDPMDGFVRHMDQITKIAGVRKANNLKNRDYDDPMAGWTKSYRDIDSYEASLTSAYYRTLMGIFGEREVSQFVKRQEDAGDKRVYDKVETGKWAAFMRMFIMENMGQPTIFTDAEVAMLPELKKGPYWLFTDHYAAEKYLKFMGRYDKKYRDVLAALDATGPNKHLIMDRLVDGTEFTAQKLKTAMMQNASEMAANLSNMEAKYQLMTLLSRPKNFINNVVGGDPNTIISTGFMHWRNTFNINYLRNNINSTWKSMSDAYAWAESHGALESFLSNELSVANKAGGASIKRGLNALVAHIQKDPMADDRTLREVWKKEGLGDAAFDKFAFFMRSSERHLRYRSFMAHYLKAREVFEVSGRTISADDPLLIEAARKGVAATQFLYNNANRPAFSRTSVGKVFSRFQLWAWNSTRFRTEIIRDMAHEGIDPNSDAGKKFQRMALFDMFTIALAAALPFSVFEMVMPQPWGWIKDTAEWLFGDEEERETAFIGGLPAGIAPLSIALPPSSRFISPIIGSLWSGEWDRFFSYHVWSYFPYGLMGRDVWNSIENPVNAPQYMLGLPLVQIGRNAAERRKYTEVGWGPYYRKEPIQDLDE